MRTHVRSALSLCALLLILTSAVAVFAQEGSPVPDDLPVGSPDVAEMIEQDAAAGEGLDTGDNAWMLMSSALVLLMTAPGLAMFYSGLVRRKNVLSVMMQCMFLMGLMTVVWALWGYSLSFGGSDPYFGNADYLFMNNVQSHYDVGASQIVTPMEGTIPRYTHMLFQGMFFIITPALICGAFAERMKFSSMALFSVLWGTFVYCPLCHWVWDEGILFYGGESAIAGGALDFAGGTVVHISSGVSALMCALLIGNRLGFGNDDMRPHNLTYTTLGAGLLWFGWFGFNAGSALSANSLAANAFAVTHFSAAAGAVAWAAMEWINHGKASVLGCASGAVAGLVCITPAAGFVLPMPALAMGALAGIICYYAVIHLKHKLHYDDSLDAFGVHGVGGTLGAILTGVFATRNVFGGAEGQPIGLYEGGGISLLIGQITAVGITILFSVVVTFLLLKLIDFTIGLRVPQENEIRGLDLAEHGEEGYIFN
ncbi:ammonium transporter [Blastopirellula sp. J2-11]|uniref:ammonium transporter n=1 Tax=Blastopirellula sp. J2-11 TaxID=2943192 RepID=UPI0021C8334F|nr:ammonium transporter [Blastopirellula sp. J2-11]UUO07378.1 ammonium transporter [Blastopirellula sp. J2-11]